MTTAAPTLDPDASLEDVLAAMRHDRASCIVLVEAGRPVGIFTQRDVVRVFHQGSPGDTPIRRLMSAPVIAIQATAPLEEAARQMDSARVRHLVVVDEAGQLVGVLDGHDLMRPLELGLVDRLLVEKKEIEKSRAEAETQLRESEERFRSLFGNMAEGVALHELLLDADGQPWNYRIVATNPRFDAMTGLDGTTVVGKTGDLAYGTPTPPYLEDYARVTLDGEPRQFETYFAPLNRHFAVSVAPWGHRGFATIFTDISDRKRQAQQLERMAHYDALTQLPNRVLLADRVRLAIDRAERAGDLLAVCYMDLDGFKPINDSHGHDVGDRLLVEVADRLRGCLRGGDTVARLGGDEFALLLSGLGNIAECEKALDRILAAIREPFALAGRSCAISASVGVTLYPIDQADPDTLLRHADLAMYMAKQAGRNRFHLFDAEHDRRARSHREAVSRIELALRQREFRLYYQPKVDMRQGVVVGLEALIRWQHPDRGVVSPGEFLPLTEDTEFAVALGDWVIGEALGQIAAWNAQGLDLAVSVNIAARHLQDADFVANLAERLWAHPSVRPSQLELEILETAALADVALASRVIEEVCRLGVTFALDDFGTGYSSLTYLKRLPVHILKIDQSFVRDMLDDAEDLAIIEGVIGLSEVFQRAVIAEGVETPEHGLLLMQLGCNLAQGYGIARPMPAEAVPAWVAAFRPDPLWQRGSGRRWAHADFPLLVVQVEHKRWVEQLAGYLLAEADTHLPPIFDTHGCRFGSWYYGAGKERYGKRPSFRALEPIHKQLHDVGQELCHLKRGGRTEAARAGLPRLHALRDQLLARLQALFDELTTDAAQGL
jgi:diguanylate cyclase (GGDEF)-like protein